MYQKPYSVFQPKTMTVLFCIAMMFAGLSVLGDFWLPIAGVLLAFLCKIVKRKIVFAVPFLGIAVYYVFGAFLTSFEYWKNPALLVGTIPLLWHVFPMLATFFVFYFTAEKKIGRTYVILILTVAYGISLLAVASFDLLWMFADQAWVKLWELIAAIEAEITTLAASVTLEGKQVLSNELILQLIYQIKALLPACYILFCMGISYVCTVVFRVLCESSQRRALLGSYPYLITVSPITAMIYLPFAVLALFFPSDSVTAFWAVTQNISLLLAPILAYCQVTRVLFRIRNRQMDTVSWLFFAGFFLLLFTDPLGALRIVGLFGAYHILRITWARRKQQNHRQSS